MKRVFGIVAVTVLVVVAAESSAWAGPIRLRIEDVTLGLGVVVTDNGAGDVNPLIGAVTYSGAVGSNFIVNVTTGVSTPLIGGVGDLGVIDLNSVNIATTGGGTLQLTLENSDFVGSTGPLEAIGTIGGTLTAPGGSSLLVQSWASGSNTVPALGADQPNSPIGAIGGTPVGSTPLWSASGAIFGPGAFSSVASAIFDNGAVDTFSLFTQVTVTLSGPGSVSFDTNVQALEVVPEPASLLLLSSGMAGGILRRRKRRNPQS